MRRSLFSHPSSLAPALRAFSHNKKRQKEKESLLDFELKTFISTGGAASFANAQAVNDGF